jgi:flagellar FliL protein
MAENEVEEDDEEKKSSKKIIIIATAVILLLAGGGAGYFFMAGDSEQKEGDQTEETENKEAEEQESKEVFYFDLEKPLIVNFPKGSAARLIQVSVSLSVEGAEALEGAEILETLKKHQPMIRNNLLMMISAKDPGDLMEKDGKQALRDDMLKEITTIMEKMTGKKSVTNVFFTTFVMQ